MIHRRAGDGQVRLFGHQPPDDLSGGKRLEIDPGSRRLLTQSGDGLRHHLQRRIGAAEHAQRTVAPEAKMGRHVLHMLHAAIDALDFGMQRAGLARGPHPTGAAFEQRHTQLDFQMPDEPADARLRDMQQARRAGDAAGLHHGLEHFDLAQIHAMAWRRAPSVSLMRSRRR
jgi:hypothetical protein